MIEALIAEPGIDWRRVVTAFHMDEYIGVCTENLIRVDNVMESPKLAE